MIFPVLELEAFLQADDKTRLDARKTHITPDEAAITLIEIEPESGSGFLDVTSLSYLDWQYSGASRTVTVSVRVTTDGLPETFSKDIEILTATDDKLFSTDAEMVPHEPQILDWVREGRNSFLDVHRTSQDRILTWLDEHRIWDTNGDRLTTDAIVDIQEVNDWSKYLTLQLIFEGISNAVDDVFSQKAFKYSEMAAKARNRAAIRLDRDGGGSIDTSPVDLRSFKLRRG